jgi:hypothetical protein
MLLVEDLNYFDAARDWLPGEHQRMRGRGGNESFPDRPHEAPRRRGRRLWGLDAASAPRFCLVVTYFVGVILLG